MSIDLAKNKDALVAAWTSVVDDKLPVNWAVFGYEGQTNTLKVVGSGCGGLEEMIEELNSCHIMYAFCRVIDTKTSLPKCVLVNWQGELAPIVRKGTCANHIRDIERLLKGAHITINARSEEDVEVELIMEKLARATGSAYKFQAPRSKDIGNSVPVGTTYKRVIPEQEINASERDEFWQKEEMEEKARVEQEKIRREEERRRVEQETRLREEKHSKIRGLDDMNKQSTVHQEIKQSDQRVQELKNLRNQQVRNKTPENDDSRCRSDELRRQRSNEAQQLIAQRTINARAVFEQNSAAGQMKTSFNSSPKLIPKEQPEKKTITESQPALQKASVDVAKVDKDYSNQPEVLPECSAPPLAIHTEHMQKQQEQEEEEEEEQQQQQQQEEQVVRGSTSEERHSEQDQSASSLPEISNVENELYNQLSGENYLYFDPTNEGMKARALYDYQAADDTEITFDPGDIITHIDAIDEGWWQGLGPDGTYGLFPANYVEVIQYSQT